jgi:hypothetical protein
VAEEQHEYETLAKDLKEELCSMRIVTLWQKQQDSYCREIRKVLKERDRDTETRTW